MPLDVAGVLRNPEYALHSTDYTSGYATNGTPDSPTNRTSGSIADSSPVLSSAQDALRLSGSGHRENSKADCRQKDKSFHKRYSSLQPRQNGCVGRFLAEPTSWC
jgi:hypothetical protein